MGFGPKSVPTALRSCGSCVWIFVLLTAGPRFGVGVSRAQTIVAAQEDGRVVYCTAPLMSSPATRKANHRVVYPSTKKRGKSSLLSIDSDIEAAAWAQQVDPQLVKAIIETESGWDPRARSHKGAMGLMQLMPATAAQFHLTDPFDAQRNILAGTKYLRSLLDRFSWDLRLALAAYNAGEGTVARFGGVPPFPETHQYLRRIATLYPEAYQQILRGHEPIHMLVQENGRIIFANY